MKISQLKVAIRRGQLPCERRAVFAGSDSLAYSFRPNSPTGLWDDRYWDSSLAAPRGDQSGPDAPRPFGVANHLHNQEG